MSTTAATAPRTGTVRSAIRHRDFRITWLGSFASNIGTWMQNVVLPAYVYERTGKASAVGVLVFAQLGPLLALSIPGGVVADRFDRRRWLISMQLVQLVFSAALAPLVAADASLAWLFFAQLGVGIGNALNAPAWSAMLPSLVPRADLTGAISLNSAMINGSRVIGPMLVAALGVAGVTTAQFFLINAVTYLFVIVALLRVHSAATTPQRATERGWRQFVSGVQIAGSNPVMMRLLLSIATFSLISLPFIGLFPAIARLNFGIAERSSQYHWLYATWGSGACLGGLAIGTVFAKRDKRPLTQAGFATFAVCMSAFALARHPVGAFVSAGLLGLAYFATTTAMLTVLQSRLADHERGRVLSLWFMAWGGMVPIGNLVAGPVIDAIGARWVLLTGALWAAVLAWWCDVRRIDLALGQEGGEAIQAGHTTTLDEHGILAGE